MKLESMTTQAAPVPMTFLPQLDLPVIADFTAAAALDSTHTAPETITISPLRQAFFSAPVASDTVAATRPISLAEQFDLARMHPLLASVALELATLSETAQSVGSLFFATTAESVAPEMRLLMNRIKTPEPPDVLAEVALAKADGGSLAQPALKEATMPMIAIPDGTDGGTMIKRESAPAHQAKVRTPRGTGPSTIPEKSHSPWSLKIGHLDASEAAQVTSPTLEAKVTEPQDRTRHDQPANKAPAPTRDRSLPSGGSRSPLIDVNLRIRLGLSEGSAEVEAPITVKTFMPVAEFGSWNGGVSLPSGQTPDRGQFGYDAKPLSGNGSRQNAEPLLAKFGPLAPVGPGVPLTPRGRPTLADLRAMTLPLEDRQALAKRPKKPAVAKIDEMGPDADSQSSGQNQDGEKRQ